MCLVTPSDVLILDTRIVYFIRIVFTGIIQKDKDNQR